MAEDYSQLRELYSQIYFTHDMPVPFKQHLTIYPVLVKDYYNFYATIDVLQVNKNEDMTGKGISMSNLEYLIYLMSNENPDHENVTRKLIAQLELSFRIKNGIRCPKCSEEYSSMTYAEVYQELEKKEKELDHKPNDTEIIQMFSEIAKCPHCGSIMTDIIQIGKDKNNQPILIVDGVEIGEEDYDLLRKVICYYNIPDYDDSYIDPKLKAELEEAARLQNPDQVSPSLEKQETCIITSTSYTYESIQNISLRHLVMLLRTIDAKLHYMAYRQASLSGFVTFKNDLPHWIYSSEKKSKYDTVQTLDSLKNKLSDVTK